jgi:nucleotide-binding universal stress UspA family protein
MKFHHILFPIDFSERSRALNPQVEWLAARFGSRVTLLHVFEIPASWVWASEASYANMDCLNELRASAQRRLNEYAIRVPETRVTRVFAEGDAALQIVDWANEHDVDLLVMGTHGYGALEGFLLGSKTAKVLQNATCPVWTDSPRHPRPSDPDISRILCAIEMRDESIWLLRFADQLAQELGATVRLLHSVPEFETRPNRYFDFDLHRYLQESARVEIAKMQREAGTYFPVTISGLGISNAVTEAASEFGADLIVTGRGKAQKPFGRFQTHIYEIVRHAPCPVLSCSVSQLERTISFSDIKSFSKSRNDQQIPTSYPAS